MRPVTSRNGYNRRELEAKVGTALEEEMQDLPEEIREILVDDMVTAFVGRMITFDRLQRLCGQRTVDEILV